MKVYLLNENYEWILFEGSFEKLKPEFDKRNIIISNSAEIEEHAKIGNCAEILRR